MNLLIHRFAHNLINTCLAAIFVLAALLPLVKPAEAQVDTVVQVSPSALDVAVGGSGTVSLEVLRGLEINAYDVTVRYDPAVITFVSWSHGGFLSHLAQVYKVDEPGTLRLVFTQLATPPVSGDGLLLNLVFRGAAEGSSEVFIEKLDFAGSDGTLTNPQLIGGTIFVSAAQPTTEPTITLPPPAATSTLLPAAITPVATTTRGIIAIATPDLQRNAPVQGSPTPTRQLTRSTPAVTTTALSISVNSSAQWHSCSSAEPGSPANWRGCCPSASSGGPVCRSTGQFSRPYAQPGALGSPGHFLHRNRLDGSNRHPAQQNSILR